MPLATAASTEGSSSSKDATKKGQKPKRPNYNHLHRHLLPIEVYPLPTLIPHNPLSILAVALTYLAQLLNPPPPLTYNGYFSSATSSVHITDDKAIRALWEMGFFGRGSLSRSEPSWLARERKKGETAEEVTTARRTERKQFKLDRAKKEQEDIESKLRKERTRNEDASGSYLRINSADIANIGNVIAKQADKAKEETVRSLEQRLHSSEPNGLPTASKSTTSTTSSTLDLDYTGNSTTIAGIPRGVVAKRQVSSGPTKAVRFSPTIEAREFDLSSPVLSPLKHPGPSPLAEQVAVPPSEVDNQEHLELSLEEAYFLTYGLGVLKIFSDGSDVVLDCVSLLSLFRRHSYFPPHNLSISLEPDDPFMISYVVYHHFRSLGWVIRSGVKFSVDYILYNKGPVFSHAEFAVTIIPSYSNSYWSETASSRAMVEKKTARSWHWLHGVNRVQTQVKKSLVLCYVDIPPPLPEGTKAGVNGIGALLQRYKIREINVRRWSPNRTRD